MQELTFKYCDNIPLVKQVLLNEFYVDNCLSGADSLQTAIDIRDKLIITLQTAGFKQRKWCLKNFHLLDCIKPQFIGKEYPLSFDNKPTVKTLGYYALSEIVLKQKQIATKSELYYNRTAHPLPPMKEGDKIFIQQTPKGPWKKGEIEAVGNNRSYSVRTADNYYLRNHRLNRKGFLS